MAKKKRQKSQRSLKKAPAAKAQKSTGYRNYLAAAIVIGAILLLLFFLKQFSSPEKVLNNLQEKNPLDTLIPAAAENGAVQFDAIISGTSSGHTARRSYIINNNPEWTELWASAARADLNGQIAAIDFSQKTLIAVFQGKQNTGGYSIEIQKVIETSDRITVSVKEISPAATCDVIQSSTAPFTIITIPKTSKEIVFETSEQTTLC